MGTEVQAATDFQSRMFARIRESMGDLMTDEELKKIVDVAVQAAFFKPSVKITNPGSYNERKEEGPIPIVSLMKELLEEQVKEMVKNWLDVHKDDVFKILKDRLDQGIVRAVTGAFDNMMSSTMSQFQFSMMEALRNMPR
jgi:hypothetical protein